MSEKIKSIPVTYKGVKFRSKLEAQWAKMLDHIHVKWLYEPAHYRLADGTAYIPDFWLPDLKAWFEVKGIMEDLDMHKVELLAAAGNPVCIGYAGGTVNGFLPDDDGTPGWSAEVFFCKCTVCGHVYVSDFNGMFLCPACGVCGVGYIDMLLDYRATKDWDKITQIDWRDEARRL